MNAGDTLRPPSLFDPLPQYSSEPAFLEPSHCRLCLQPVLPGQEEKHLKDCAKCNVEEYRRIVLRKTLGEWPQRIPAQVLRSRLAAFKEELCDANFRQVPCASCCRLKRKSKLFDVSFPHPDSDDPPAWLSWNQEQWLEHRRACYDLISTVFDTDVYLNTFCLCQERVTVAEREVKTFVENSTVPSSMQTLVAADAWLRRVRKWQENLRRDLLCDSILAPGGCVSKW